MLHFYFAWHRTSTWMYMWITACVLVHPACSAPASPHSLVATSPSLSPVKATTHALVKGSAAAKTQAVSTTNYPTVPRPKTYPTIRKHKSKDKETNRDNSGNSVTTASVASIVKSHGTENSTAQDQGMLKEPPADLKTVVIAIAACIGGLICCFCCLQGASKALGCVSLRRLTQRKNAVADRVVFQPVLVAGKTISKPRPISAPLDRGLCGQAVLQQDEHSNGEGDGAAYHIDNRMCPTLATKATYRPWA
ncbi:hypothetical protein BC939DRAFT_446674 [Gamsiella multidivaricata]|uniref:uncharacterized protein n=1 Tax=Gamsiella multidivaricata TaxID=101098 RepID=UPI00221F6291|nr:uncharacterized protein BC939DRAFT_446674 [Gamsiella multidivaricata]KAI7826535.1 hypothetical protein BC939DRAFT_446674 [Gamsiella multidivaricata]